MNDTIQILKVLKNDPIPYVNTGVFLGMTAMDWDLALKVILGFVSIGWTCLKIYNEVMILRKKRSETENDQKDI
jgi:hypothetical protein